MNEAQRMLDENFGEGVYRAVKRAESEIETTELGSKIIRVRYRNSLGEEKKLARYITSHDPELLIETALEDLAYGEALLAYRDSEDDALRAKALSELYGDRSEDSLSLEEQRVFLKYLELYRESQQEK